MNRVEVLVGPPGCGKTSELLVEMSSVKGRYIFALPTIKLIGEQLKALFLQVGKSGTEPHIRTIHGDVTGRRSARKATPFRLVAVDRRRTCRRRIVMNNCSGA